MADLSLPLVIVGPVVVAMSGAIGAMWVRLADREKRIQSLEEDNGELRERVTREVKRGAYLYAVTALEPPKQSPELPPSPDWEENTAVRNERKQAELEALFSAYRESTPPRPRGKLPSRRD